MSQRDFKLLNEGTQYALKRLVEDVLKEDSESETAAKDIAFEAAILSKLQQHENIIHLQTVSTGF